MIRLLVLLALAALLVSAAPPPRALPPAVVSVPHVARPVVVHPAPRFSAATDVRQTAVPLEQPTCDQTNAVAVLRAAVYGDVHGQRMQIGSAVAWSCSSVAAAQHNLERQIALVHQQAAQWYGIGATP